MDVALGLLLLFLIWVALPARWWPVDVVGSALALLLGGAGVGLWLGTPWARRAGIAAGAVALTVGALTTTALAFTAAHLAGMYGPVGQGGATILFVVALLIVPYLVALPAAQLFALARRGAPKDG